MLFCGYRNTDLPSTINLLFMFYTRRNDGRAPLAAVRTAPRLQPALRLPRLFLYVTSTLAVPSALPATHKNLTPLEPNVSEKLYLDQFGEKFAVEKKLKY